MTMGDRCASSQKVHICVQRYSLRIYGMWHSKWKKTELNTLADLMNASVIFWCTEMSVLIIIITIINFSECHLHTEIEV